jgi:hypothetical protein
MLSLKRRAAMPELHPHAVSQPSQDHELTPMEGFFDNLFNHHMVLPQPPETPPPINGVEGHDPVRDSHRNEAD